MKPFFLKWVWSWGKGLIFPFKRIVEGAVILGGLYSAGILVWSPLSFGIDGSLAALVFLVLTAASVTASRWRWEWIWAGAALAVTVMIPFSNLKAPLHGDFQESCSALAHVEFFADTAVVHNLRDFSYHTDTDFDVCYRTETYDLRKVEALDLAVSHWGQDAIGHTMFVFRFSDGQNIVLSVETRLRNGQEQSAVAGLFKAIPVIWILGTENDLLRLRSNYRHEDLYLYPTKTTKEEAQKALRYIFSRVNKLSAEPEFYNTLSDNCTTSLAPIVNELYPGIGWDIRGLLNGYSDQLAFDMGWLPNPQKVSYAYYRSYHMVNLRTQTLSDTATAQDYGNCIRQGFRGADDREGRELPFL